MMIRQYLLPNSSAKRAKGFIFRNISHSQMTSAEPVRSLEANFERSSCCTTENLPLSLQPLFHSTCEISQSDFESEFFWHARTTAAFSFFFPPMDFHLTDKQKGRGGEERKRKKDLLNSISV